MDEVVRCVSSLHIYIICMKRNGFKLTYLSKYIASRVPEYTIHKTCYNWSISIYLVEFLHFWILLHAHSQYILLSFHENIQVNLAILCWVAGVWRWWEETRKENKNEWENIQEFGGNFFFTWPSVRLENYNVHMHELGENRVYLNVDVFGGR